jgi:bacillolysin
MIKQYQATLAVGALALIIAFGSGIPQTRAASDFNKAGLNSIQQLKRDGARIGYHKRTGKVNFIGFGPDQFLAVPGMFAGRSAEENAQAALAQFAPMFGIRNPATDLREMKQFTSSDGRSMVRYQQYQGGIPVIGGELIVNMNAQGQLMSMNGEAFADAISNTQATVPASDARQKALEFVATHHSAATSSLNSSDPVLSIYAPELIGPSSMPPMLVWKTEISSINSEPINEFVLVHAQRGNIALHFNQVHTAKNRNTYDGSTVAVPSDLPGTLLCNESSGDACTGGADADADAAHIHAGDTYDFYFTYHGRDSIDGSGMALTSTVSFNVVGICPNAFWYSPANQMIYCASFPLADDVVAHEFTHGITDRTSKLFYYYQSGAINESLSDVWGEFIDQTNGRGTDNDLLPPAGVKWLLGEDLPITIGPIRSMSDPTLYGDPDRMTSTDYYTSSLDNGGVHHNSGINNKAAYLMVDGGTFNGHTVTPMALVKVARIYYEVQTRLLTSGSDYLDLHHALYQGCLNLVGTNNISNSNCDNVREATLAVEMDQEPSAGFNPEASLCPAGQAPSNLFYDDFEQGIGKWTIGGPIGATTTVWTQDSADGPYATSGKHSLYADDSIGSNHTYATMTTGVTIPVGGLQFHFNQAFGFGAPGQGGGHVQYSINGGTFQDAQPLFAAGQDYNGLILAGPTSGTNGFIESSHGYVSSRYEITTNAGDTIKFRFDLGTANVPDSGWWIDDVRLYTCVPNTPPSAPELVSPADGATDVNSAEVEFKWKPSTDDNSDVIDYTLEVCNDSGFTSCATTVTKSNAATTFVAAGAGGGTGLLLVSLLFAGRHRRVGAVALIFSVSLLLSSCGGGSKSQPVYVTYVDNTLSPGMTYYWRVTADDGNGGSTTSVERSFTTAP